MPLLKLVSSKNPRQFAAQILQQRRPNGEFIESLLDKGLAAAGLSPADRGLCQEIVYGVVRRQGTLDWLIARKTDGREQKTALQNLLRTGLYQIFWLDRVPPHAAVHETVEIAKHLGFGPQAGFINAVLRGYLREIDATKAALEDLKISDPAIGYSHPEWLVKKWQHQFGDGKTRELLEWNNLSPKTYARVNLLKAEGEKRESENNQGPVAPAAKKMKDAGGLVERWREEDVDYDFVRCDWLDENLVFELRSHPSLASLGSFRDGWFYVQDPSTLLAVRELGPRPGETILDLCAAPGGKTTFLAQRMEDRGQIVAADVSEERLRLIRENCERLGVTCVELKLTSALDLRSPAFDRILVDAPCSNTGVMRRRVDLRWRITADEIERLRRTQLDLLTSAAAALKPGGSLVYSTCSLEPEENAGVVKEFLGSHPDFKLDSDRALFPPADQVDGAYVARLRKG